MMMKIPCTSGNPRYWWMMKLCIVIEKIIIMNNYFFHDYVLFRVILFPLKKKRWKKNCLLHHVIAEYTNGTVVWKFKHQEGIVFKYELLIVGKWFFSEVRRCWKGIQTLKRRGKTTFFISLCCFLFHIGYLNLVFLSFTWGQGYLKLRSY